MDINTQTMDVILLQILPRLPVKPLTRFKCVCKAFNTFISSQEFAHLHLLYSASSHQDRLLILQHANCSVQSLSLNSLEPVLETSVWYNCGPGTRLAGTCNGLLCIADLDTALVILYDPCNRSYFEVPYDEKFARYSRVFRLGYDHVNDDYKIVMLCRYHNNDDIRVRSDDIMVYSVRTKSWKLVSHNTSLEHCSRRSEEIQWRSSVVINQHLLLFLVITSENLGKIGCFDIQSEQWRDCVQLPDYYSCDNSCCVRLNDFGDLDGCLYTSFVNENDSSLDVWVMKEYGVKDSWTKLLRLPSGGFSPITYATGSSQILLRRRARPELFWYNVIGEDLVRANFHLNRMRCYEPVYICKQSFVTLPGAKRLGEEGDATERERMQKLNYNVE